MSTAKPLGIDVGGSGIKGAPVDLASGELSQERMRLDTPLVSTPEAVCEVIATVVGFFAEVRDASPIGVTIPGVVQHGVVKTAANIDKSWIDCEIETLLEDRLQHDVVVVTTLGTGIGTALIHDGVLVPNSELGHLEIGGVDAETVTASSAKTREDLSWEEWAQRLQRYYRHLEDLIWPDLIVVGGGVSRKADRFLPLLDLRTPIVPAALENTAGIIGAAVLATQTQEVRGRHRG